MTESIINQPEDSQFKISQNIRSKKLQDNINYIFEKKFCYQSSGWKTPPAKELFKDFYQLESLQALKKHLNAVKAKLNDFEIEEWSSHTRRRDPTNEIPWKLKNEIKAEFVTVAWCKFYECLNQFRLVRGPKLNSLHLCEAPGAFVTSINHYLYSKYDANEVKWQWIASSLNPFYEGNPLNKMIVDIRFMLFSLNNWIFYEDFTGNIISKRNIENMAQECQKRLNGEEIHLITADGSVDCTETPDHQEEFVCNLHYAEICAALKILANGGCLVLKMFTLFEASSMSKVFLLNCVFDQVTVYKPATSKSGNSEVYLICVGFRKNQIVNFPEILNLMLSKLTASKNILPIFQRKDIPEDFCLQHEIACRLFMVYQIKAIEDNIKSFSSSKCRIAGKHYHFFRSQITDEYFKRYNIRPIPFDRKIIPNHQDIIQEQGVKTRITSGSYTNRRLMENITKEEKFFTFESTLNKLIKSMDFSYGEIVNWKRSSNESNIDLHIYHSAPFNTFNSSLFSTYQILMLRLNLQEIIAIDPIWYNLPICKINTETEYLFSPSESDNFSFYQQEFFCKILQSIVDSEPQCIIFQNYPILTHFAASMLRYLSANVFLNCCIKSNPDFEIILTNCCYDQTMKDRLKGLLAMIETNGIHFHCIVDIVHLHHNEFFRKITEFNDHLLIRNYKSLLDHVP